MSIPLPLGLYFLVTFGALAVAGLGIQPGDARWRWSYAPAALIGLAHAVFAIVYGIPAFVVAARELGRCHGFDC